MKTPQIEPERFTISTDELAVAFTEWQRRYQENPEAFLSAQEQQAQNPQTYGELSAPYFAGILKLVILRAIP